MVHMYICGSVSNPSSLAFNNRRNALDAFSLRRAFYLLDIQNSTFNQIVQGAFQGSCTKLSRLSQEKKGSILMTNWGRYDHLCYITKGQKVNIVFKPLVFKP